VLASTAILMVVVPVEPGARANPLCENVVPHPGLVEERLKVLVAQAEESLFVTETA
jgi:hypothetical protein